MKVITGLYKGRVLEGFTIDGTRPTMDRVKESLFAMLQSKMIGSVVLDLFSGSGNLGIEAISEGASFAYLVDSNRKATNIIEKNINRGIISLTLKESGLENNSIITYQGGKLAEIVINFSYILCPKVFFDFLRIIYLFS